MLLPLSIPLPMLLDKRYDNSNASNGINKASDRKKCDNIHITKTTKANYNNTDNIIMLMLYVL